MVHPRARLDCALAMVGRTRVLADIGCDHGRFCCAAVQRGVAGHAIGTDISAASLDKARTLVERTGLDARVELRLGDGFAPLKNGEAEICCLLGMGGTLMARLLDDAETSFQGASRILFQPMRAAEDIRAWLFYRGCRILDDRLVMEHGRIYQVFMAAPPQNEPLQTPPEWPAGFFKLGYTAFRTRDPLLAVAARRMLERHETQLRKGRSETLLRETGQLKQILDYFEE